MTLPGSVFVKMSAGSIGIRMLGELAPDWGETEARFYRHLAPIHDRAPAARTAPGSESDRSLRGGASGYDLLALPVPRHPAST